MKNPILIILVFYIIGILSAKFIPSELLFLFTLSSLFTFILILIKKRKWQISILAVALSLGCLSYNHAIKSQLNEFNDKYVHITGQICEIPSLPNEQSNYQYTILSTEIVYDNISYNIKEKVNISTPNKYPYGSVISAEGFLTPYTGVNSIGKFNSKQYNSTRDISYHLFADTEYSSLIQSTTTPNSIYDAFNRIKTKSCDILDNKFSAKNSATLKYALFDISTNSSPEFNENLLHQSVSQHFNSPYLYTIIISFISAILFKYFKATRKFVDIFCFIILALLMCINCHSPTFAKCTLLYLCYKLYTYKYGYLYIPDSLSAAILVLLIFNPLYIYSRAFIMSTSSTVMLLFFKNHLLNLFNIIRPYCLRNFISIFLIFNVLMLPLAAYLFNSISIYTLITSFVLIPILLIAVILSPIMLTLNLIFGQAPILNDIFNLIASFINITANIISSLPMSYIILPTPTLTELFMHFSILIVIKCCIEKNIFCIEFKVFATMSIVFFMLICADKITELDKLNVNIVNVGQGDAAVLNIPHHETVIIDGGGSSVMSTYNIGDNVFVPYLTHYGLTKIDLAIVTHYHKDHVEGIISAIKSANVKRVILPNCTPDNEYRILLEQTAKENNTEIIYAKVGMKIKFNSGLEINLLSPDNIALFLADYDLNCSSIVAEVSYGEFDMLFTGDIPENIEKRLIKKDLLKEYDVVKLPHHGSATSSCDEFLDITNPEYAIICVGKDNEYNLPHPNTIDKLQNRNITILSTDRLNDVCIQATKNGIHKIKHFKGGN